MDPYDIVRDSSIWRHTADQAAITRKDPYLRLGIVKRIYRDTVTTEIRYLVEVRDSNDAIEVNASLLRRIGGIFNYDDTILQGYKVSNLPDPTQDFKTKAGDTVLVAFLNGEGREAVILGGVHHPGRVSTLPIDDGPQYLAEFNGMETSINSDGEYTMTFKGIPTNIGILANTPSIQLPAPTYDATVGTTYVKFDKTGGWEINDNATSDPQNIHIDKAGGQILLNSGKIALSFTKASEAVSLACKTVEVKAETSINETTDAWSVDASSTASIKSPKIAFGTDSIELLSQLAQLIDALGTLTAISPVGPCSPLTGAPQWSQVMAIQNKIKEITGSVS